MTDFYQAWALLCGFKEKFTPDEMEEICKEVEKNQTNVSHEIHALKIRKGQIRRGCECNGCR